MLCRELAFLKFEFVEEFVAIEDVNVLLPLVLIALPVDKVLLT